jgi:hypothetical protein
MSNELVPAEIIENKIYVIRSHKVMLDSDLANLYGVETRILNRNVKRNINRFPEEFMFQLTDTEWESLISQFGISNKSRGGRQKRPYVFTEHGVLMLSSVLNSERAITVNIHIMRIFVKLRELALTHKELAQRLDELEKTVITLSKDTRTDINEIFRQLKNLTDITKPSKTEKIGFNVEDSDN